MKTVATQLNEALDSLRKLGKQPLAAAISESKVMSVEAKLKACYDSGAVEVKPTPIRKNLGAGDNGPIDHNKRSVNESDRTRKFVDSIRESLNVTQAEALIIAGVSEGDYKAAITENDPLVKNLVSAGFTEAEAKIIAGI